MKSGNMRVEYHAQSDLRLNDREEEELVAQLAKTGLDVTFRPAAGPQGRGIRFAPASLVLQWTSLVLVITGSLVAKTILQELAKDMYAYWKKRLVERRKGKGQQLTHYGIVLTFTIQEETISVAIAFEDEETLAIACYRLKESVNLDGKGQRFLEGGIVDLTCPTGLIKRNIWVPVAFTSALPFMLFLKPEKTDRFSMVLLGVAVTVGSWLVLFIVPYWREKVYRRRFALLVQEWLRKTD